MVLARLADGVASIELHVPVNIFNEAVDCLLKSLLWSDLDGLQLFSWQISLAQNGCILSFRILRFFFSSDLRLAVT